MPKILITGNGFDLSLGLPTAYNDFIRVMSYVKSAQLTDINFQSVFSNLENHQKFFEQFNAFEIDKTEIKKIKPILAENLWFKYFEDKLNFQTWIDFEEEIEKIIRCLLDSIDIIEQNAFNFKEGDLDYQVSVFDRLNQKNRLSFLIAYRFHLILGSSESGSYYLNDEFARYESQSFIQIEQKMFFSVLIQELYSFISLLNQYFNKFIQPMIHSLKSIDKRFSKIDYHFTFNYTSTFERLANKTEVTKYLHGRANDGDKLIVLGFNSYTMDNSLSKEILPFIKYFQKLHFDTDYMFLSTLDKSKNQNFEFYLFGHSLNESDKDYINEIFDFYKSINKYSSVQIVVFYHNEESRFSLLKNLLHLRGKSEIESKMKAKSLRFIESNSEEMISVLTKSCPPTTSNYNSSMV
jgi:hypothetical protein